MKQLKPVITKLWSAVGKKKCFRNDKMYFQKDIIGQTSYYVSEVRRLWLPFAVSTVEVGKKLSWKRPRLGFALLKTSYFNIKIKVQICHHCF